MNVELRVVQYRFVISIGACSTRIFKANLYSSRDPSGPARALIEKHCNKIIVLEPYVMTRVGPLRPPCLAQGGGSQRKGDLLIYFFIEWIRSDRARKKFDSQSWLRCWPQPTTRSIGAYHYIVKDCKWNDLSKYLVAFQQSHVIAVTNGHFLSFLICFFSFVEWSRLKMYTEN